MASGTGNLMKSYQQIVAQAWEMIGEYLYDVKLDQAVTSDQGKLWDFYDLYPQWLQNQIDGKCSLTDSLSFTFDHVMTDIIEILEILGRVINGEREITPLFRK